MILNNTLGTTTSTIFNSTGTSAITVVYLCNTSTAPVTVNLYVVPNGQTVGVGNTIYSDISIPAGDTFIVDTERLILDSGDQLMADASTGSVVVATVSSMSI